MFNNTARGLTFQNKIAPKNGQYKFLVTELYDCNGKDIDVNYVVNKPANLINFQRTEQGFVLDMEDTVFQDLQEKANQLGCEIYIYPKFTE
jgi:hypothetical protein